MRVQRRRGELVDVGAYCVCVVLFRATDYATESDKRIKNSRQPATEQVFVNCIVFVPIFHLGDLEDMSWGGKANSNQFVEAMKRSLTTTRGPLDVIMFTRTKIIYTHPQQIHV